ncbi:MAG TPA: NAD(P)H-hydrate dehydratase [Nitrososphaerales archaeon]
MVQTVKVTEEMVRTNLRNRALDSRKGQNGVVSVIGGSRLYHGAPFLAAYAALRSGVDLVYLSVPQSISTAVRALSPDLIIIPRPDVKLTTGAVNRLLNWLPETGSAVIGPGLGHQKRDGVCKLVSELALKDIKIVLDADALTNDIVNKVRNKKSVITPHAGEFKRVFNVEVESSVESRIEKVEEMARRSGVTILLKGPIDVISDGEKTALNHTGSQAMTVGGTGDVLSGIVAGLLAKGLEPFYAASIAAYFNGLAGEKAAEKRGMHIVASDLFNEIPAVMKPFDSV